MLVVHSLTIAQNRSRSLGSERLRSRRQHVREEGTATTRGKDSSFISLDLISDASAQWYRHAHAKDMPLGAIARLIQTMLYGRRFFPYYVYNILGGIEEDGMPIMHCVSLPPLISHSGTGAVYSFDPVGSYEREACRAAGAAQSLVQPFLDNQVCVVSSRPARLVSRMAVRFLTDLHPAPDLLQEPAGTRWPTTPPPPATIRRPRYRHRFIHKRDRASHRSAYPRLSHAYTI